MFDILSEKLQGIFKKLSGRGRLTEKDVDEALREVRLALLEADVHFRVARDLISRVRERAVGADVLESLTPGQQVIKIIYEELVSTLGEGQSRLIISSTPPTIVMLVGLQGSGKTTTAAKLALHLRKTGRRPLLVAADLRRPAAVAQLVTLGKQLDIPVYTEGAQGDPLATATNSIKEGKAIAASDIILDTQGRLHVDQDMMDELKTIRDSLHPHEILLVVDAMMGQDALRTAEDFNRQVGLTGLILTKMDGDARGGAALSARSITGVSVKFVGTGEKPDALEPFYPDRLASRILGMGDVLTLIERAQETFDQKRAEEWEKKLRKAQFNLEDFLEQLQQLKQMGPLSQLLEMIPGMSKLSRQIPAAALDNQQIKKVEAIVYSMTPQERQNPDIIGGSRRRRIARGSGTTPQDVNQLLNQFRQMQKILQQFSAPSGRGAKGRRPNPFDLFRM